MTDVIKETEPVCKLGLYGDKFWYVNGLKHRTDGPASEWTDGLNEWWINGERHRADGPAIEHPDGNKYWYLSGKEYSIEDYCKELYKDKWEIYFTKYSLMYE